MAITTNIVVGISDVNNEPDAILLRSVENSDDINIQVTTAKFSVKHLELSQAICIVQDFIKNREPIETRSNVAVISEIVYGEDN